jgi:hypothetical protein
VETVLKAAVDEIYEALNKAENLTETHDSWGGSNTIGGSPRKSGSTLAPMDVEQIINDVILTKSEGSETQRLTG